MTTKQLLYSATLNTPGLPNKAKKSQLSIVEVSIVEERLRI
jgi:hypothetical protein